MKLTRLAASAATIALAGAAVLAAAAPSIAADAYYQDSAFGAEGSSYPAGWFTGNPQPTTAIDSTPAGLVLTGRTQILFGGEEDATQLRALIDSADFSLASGTATFQIPLFLDDANRGGFTTLRPAVSNAVSSTDNWVTSQAIGTLAAGSSNPLSAYEAIIADSALSPDPVILAYGLHVNAGTTTVVESVTWNGDTSYFIAPPVAGPPVAVPAPADFTG